ncbi:Glutathione peroxidase 2 [Savitreella phatthalungensis]
MRRGSKASSLASAKGTTIYDFKPTWKRGEYDMSSLRGQVVLVVNTASQCGFTPQFAGLEAVHQKFKDRGLAVVGFPCNQFGGQDPGSNDDITSFCQLNYGVSFPVMDKIDVNGDDTHPVFRYLKEEKPGLLGLTRIKWNFEKFLCDRNGKVYARYSSLTKPESIEADIEKLLAQPPSTPHIPADDDAEAPKI